MSLGAFARASHGGAPPILGLYTGSNTVSAITSLGNTLAVPVRGYSFYTDGSSWSSIGSWTVPGTLPTGATLILSVDLTPNATGLSAVPANTSHFGTLAASLPNNTIVRLGWEFEIATGPWGAGVNGNTAAQYVTAWQAVIPVMRGVNPTFKFDWCCNTGTSNLAQLETYYPGDSYVDFIGGDHYDTPGGGGDFSQFGAVVNLANLRNKPVSCGEWGLASSSTTDDPTFINDGAQFFLRTAQASVRYSFPAYTVGYQSYFSALNSIITNYPNSQAAYSAAFS